MSKDKVESLVKGWGRSTIGRLRRQLHETSLNLHRLTFSPSDDGLNNSTDSDDTDVGSPGDLIPISPTTK